MSLQKAKEYLAQFNLADKVQEFNVSSATVELASKALNCEPGKIAKSLTFKLDDKPIMILVAGDKRIDNRKYKNKFNKKAKMLTPDEAKTLIGHSVGGICPFGVNDGIEIYLDESLKDYSTVFPACGSSNSAIELSIEKLEEVVPYKEWIDISK